MTAQAAVWWRSSGPWPLAALMIVAIGGSLVPDLVRVAADPVLCDGDLVRQSDSRPLQDGNGVRISHRLLCVTDDGADDVMMRALVVVGVELFLVLAAVVVAARLRKRVRSSLPEDDWRRFDVLAGGPVLLVLTGVGVWQAWSGWSADPRDHGTVWAGGMVLWLAAVVLGLLRRPIDLELPDGQLRLRTLLRLPMFGLVTLGPGALAFWYARQGMASGEVGRSVTTGIGVVLLALGALLFIGGVRTVLAPRPRLEVARARRERRGPSPVAPGASVTRGARVAPPATGDTLDDLREATELHRSGALTDEEFTALKARLLGLDQPAP